MAAGSGYHEDKQIRQVSEISSRDKYQPVKGTNVA
jgi:hypothetical protein